MVRVKDYTTETIVKEGKVVVEPMHATWEKCLVICEGNVITAEGIDGLTDIGMRIVIATPELYVSYDGGLNWYKCGKWK